MGLHQLNARTQRLMAWGSPILVVMLFSGMIMSGLLPPPGPDSSAEEFASDLSRNTNLKRTGLLIMMVGIALYGTWCAVITLWIRRMEDGKYPVLAWASAILCGCGLMIFESCPLIWAVAAFRPDEVDPELTRGFYDFGWFMFLYSWPTFSLWFFVFAVAIFRDKHVPTLLPRWLGYMSVWAGLLLFPAALIGYFKDGPFAYNGALAMWMPLIVFCSYMLAVSYCLLQAINREENRIKAEVDAEKGVPVGS